MRETLYRPATLVVHQGTDRDPYTGAATVPIYQASTYHHPGGTSGDYDYARSGNPSRAQIEQAIALLEAGCSGFAYSSGMAAIAGSLSLLKAGDHLIAPRDLYGGTWRYLNRILPDLGISVTFVDTGDLDAIHKAIQPDTKGLFLETPSNPLFNITDIRSAAALAKEHKLISFLDNTFMTPLLQKPIVLGIDVVIHSATKFLGGHSDLLAGLVTTNDNGLAQRLKRHQNAYGSVLAPFDSFLLSRGVKTLKLRLETGQSNARTIAERLCSHPAIERVIYPGLDHFPGAERHFAQ
ncbi:MAG: aminotransferase class I/II-fold pyridoxal phosphate-dependent enzyme, partial [Deltaproteobacteria bacterium]|nr:aminotransferase class I/II-fold pyridoxal phosphate-dependent enzyme [Deltaproteobacteria bacterium]